MIELMCLRHHNIDDLANTIYDPDAESVWFSTQDDSSFRMILR